MGFGGKEGRGGGTGGVDVQEHHAGHRTEGVHHPHTSLVGAAGFERGEVVHEPVAGGHEGGSEGGAAPIEGTGITDDAGDVAVGRRRRRRSEAAAVREGGEEGIRVRVDQLVDGVSEGVGVGEKSKLGDGKGAGRTGQSDSTFWAGIITRSVMVAGRAWAEMRR